MKQQQQHKNEWIEIQCDAFRFYYLSKVFTSSSFLFAAIHIRYSMERAIYRAGILFAKESLVIISDDNKSFSSGMWEFVGWKFRPSAEIHRILEFRSRRCITQMYFYEKT